MTKLGYEVIGVIPRGEEALNYIKDNRPDIILMDIHLKGKLDGIETAQQIQKKYDTPIIYLTANADEAHFNRAKSTKPQAFISKPFKKLDLQRAIELTLSRIEEEKEADNGTVENAYSTFVLSDSIFVKHLDKMVKIIINDILYAEAERNYCRIYTKNKEYLLVLTLKDLDEKNQMRISCEYTDRLLSIFPRLMSWEILMLWWLAKPFRSVKTTAMS